MQSFDWELMDYDNPQKELFGDKKKQEGDND